MDISTINDINELMSLAYKQVLAIEQAQATADQASNNRRIIHARIAELEKQERAEEEIPEDIGQDTETPEE